MEVTPTDAAPPMAIQHAGQMMKRRITEFASA
ncbi:hypothetical protein SY94_6098 (plasmid) [Agrobacterium tumefaciens]|nr:hypothetical protein SY94_6098 [Agrobacterium tumefaciens]